MFIKVSDLRNGQEVKINGKVEIIDQVQIDRFGRDAAIWIKGRNESIFLKAKDMVDWV